MSSESTRERLLRAAVAVIAADGWGGVSTRIVAERAGVNPGVVHYHFDSIDHLRRAAVVRALEEALTEATVGMADLTPRDFLTSLAAMMDELGSAGPLSMVMYEALPAAARDPLLREALAERLQWFRSALAERVRACHPRPGADPEILAEVIAAVFDGLGVHLLARPDLDVGAHLAPVLQLLGPEAPMDGVPGPEDRDRPTSADPPRDPQPATTADPPREPQPAATAGMHHDLRAAATDDDLEPR